MADQLGLVLFAKANQVFSQRALAVWGRLVERDPKGSRKLDQFLRIWAARVDGR